MPTEIAQHYLKGWFIIDFSSTVPIDTIVKSIVQDGGSGLRILKTIRILRLIRLLKLVRLLKLSSLFSDVDSYFEISPSTMRLLSLLFQVSFIAHLLGCFWHFTIIIQEEPSDWFSEANTAPGTSRYVASIYWAFTTMTTVGYGDLVARSNTEMGYACFGMLLGATVFAYIVGSMASVVGKFGQTSAVYKERMDEIIEYAKERGLSKAIRRRMLRFTELSLEMKSSYDEEGILSDLPTTLRRDAILHLNRDIIQRVPFFQKQDKGFLSYLCEMLLPQQYLPGDIIFNEGDYGDEMYFLVKGCVEIVGAMGSNDETIYRELRSGSWFGEIAVVTEMERTASARTQTYSNLFSLKREALDKLAEFYPSFVSNIKKAIVEATNGNHEID